MILLLYLPIFLLTDIVRYVPAFARYILDLSSKVSLSFTSLIMFCFVLILGIEQVVLKENSSPQDMLKSMFHVNYLYWLEKNAGILSSGVCSDCRPEGRLQMSLEYVEREFCHVKNDSEIVGWMADSLIARPLPNRIRPGYPIASPVMAG